MTKTVLIIGSDGSEEMELVITSDVLRRAGIGVTVGGLQDKEVIECARQTKLKVDALFKDVKDDLFEAVILPGGKPGAENLAEDSRVREILQRHEKAGKLLAAICAGPIAFASHGIAKGARLTSYPSVRDKIEGAGYKYSEEKVCIWNNVVTSRAPGTAFDFALKLVELLLGVEQAKSVRNSLLLDQK